MGNLTPQYKKDFEIYERQSKIWNEKRKAVYEKNQELIAQWNNLSWWQKLGKDSPRQQILDNWEAFRRTPIPRMPQILYFFDVKV